MCYSARDGRVGGYISADGALNGVDSVERTILRLAGFQHDDATSSERNGLDGMDVTAFRHWYTAHHHAVSTCSLTSSDLHR